MLAAKSQASTPSTPPPPNSAIEQINAKQHTGGLYIRDAMQINNDFSKLAGVVAAAASEAMAVCIPLHLFFELRRSQVNF